MKRFGHRLAPGLLFVRHVFTTQFPRIRLALVAGLLAALVGIMSVYILSLVTGAPVSVFTRDPAAITKSQSLYWFSLHFRCYGMGCSDGNLLYGSRIVQLRSAPSEIDSIPVLIWGS